MLVLALLVLGVIAVRAFVVAPVRIGSSRMEPTLHRGDVVLVTRWAPQDVAHGDLVVFDEPGAGPTAGDDTLKRVVGLPGERIVIRDSVLYVDGRPAAEPFVDHAAIDGYYSRTFVVPPGSVFVLGDNRGNSIDSRDYGSIPVAQLRGEAVVRAWPPGPWPDTGGRPPKP